MATVAFQVFAKTPDNRTVTVNDILPGMPVEDLRAAVAARVPMPTARAGMRFAGRTLEDGTTIDGYGVKSESTIHMYVRALVEDVQHQGVLTQLRADLVAIARYASDRTFIFIGVGSYDNNHGTASIKRQQCPDPLLHYCRTNGWDLCILLIDPGFGGDDGAPQLWDVAGRGWIDTPFYEELGGLIQYYTDIAGGGHNVIITYKTGVPEYDLLSSVNDRTRVAGVKLARIMALMQHRGLRNTCIVSGNFYADAPNDNQFITLGNLGVIAECGFKANP